MLADQFRVERRPLRPPRDRSVQTDDVDGLLELAAVCNLHHRTRPSSVSRKQGYLRIGAASPIPSRKPGKWQRAPGYLARPVPIIITASDHIVHRRRTICRPDKALDWPACHPSPAQTFKHLLARVETRHAPEQLPAARQLG